MFRAKNQPYVLVFGASLVDIFGFCNKNYRSHDSIPGKVKVTFGGVSRNIAENMARMKVNTKFISILGNDEFGGSMLDHAKTVGYDMEDSLILENGGTPTYMAVLDESGEMVSAIADLDSIKEMNPAFIDSKADIIEKSEYTFLDSDDPENLQYILEKFKNKTNFILDPVSTNKAKNIKHLIKYFHSIKPNKHEAEILSGIEIKNNDDLRRAGKYFIDLGIKDVFISLDENGVYYNNGKEEGRMKALNPEVKNVTGAGDSFVAGIGYGYMNQLSIVDTVKVAIAMSIVTISHEDTIHPKMSKEFVEEIIDNTKWEITKF